MIILLLILSLSSSPCIPSYASSFDNCYARIMYDDVYLYRTSYEFDDYSNIYFLLPKTYFVEIVGMENECYQVNYLNFTGYVKKDQVKPVSNTPLTPYLKDIHFRVFGEISRDMRTSPTTLYTSSKQVVYVPLYSCNMTYLGKVAGETVVPERTNIWYYCKYTADKDYYGYIYSDFCDKMTEIRENTEEVTYIDAPIIKVDPAPDSLPVENKMTGLIILILSIPAVIFLIILLKNSHAFTNTHQKSKEIGEYYD